MKQVLHPLPCPLPDPSGENEVLEISGGGEDACLSVPTRHVLRHLHDRVAQVC